MKKPSFFLFVLTIILSFNCGNTQTKNSDEQIIEMLYKFYSERNNIWTVEPPYQIEILEKKLDSLCAIYCSSELREKAKKSLEGDYGEDIITKGLGSVDLNENLKVTKSQNAENEYIVTFIASTTDAGNKPVKQNVVLYALVVKDSVGFRIAKVY